MLSPKERGRRKKVWFLVYMPIVMVSLSVIAFGYFLLREGKLDALLGTNFAGKQSSPAQNAAHEAATKLLHKRIIKGNPPPQKLSPIQKINHDAVVNTRQSIHTGILWPKLLDKTPKYMVPDHNVSVHISNEYPVYSSLLSIIEAWNPDDPDQPSIFTEQLQHFNYSDPVEREIAGRYRDAEVPFKLYNVPEVDAVTRKWSDKYLAEIFNREGHRVEVAKSNHFMFWSHSSMKSIDPNWEPPTENIKMSFPEWRKIADDADRNKLKNDTTHYYFHANALAGDRRNSFVARDLNFFATDKENFFITNVAANKGIQCRFGMRGIIAATHYDGGKNMVAMLKGQKRYILSAPFTCRYLGIISDRRHTSFRHSVIDWSNVAEAKAARFDEVPAIDTIVKEGEVLYIPSYWFHYPISMQYSIQCNSRSGAPPYGEGQAEIESCTGSKLGGSGDRNFRKKTSPGVRGSIGGVRGPIGVK